MKQVRQIAANPPIEQTGSIVRIGARHENLHNISIDYEIQAPADAYLNAATGSGEITDDGVGQNAKLSTGSGSIHATGLHGSISLETGSGGIYADQTGDGDVKAETGSGSIELRNLHGGLHAETGSGSIKAGGTPTGPWKTGDRLGQHRNLDRRCRHDARCRNRLGRHSYRSRNDDPGNYRQASRDRQDQRRRPNGKD